MMTTDPQKNDAHPTMKPVEMPCYRIDNYSKLKLMAIDSSAWLLDVLSHIFSTEEIDRNCQAMRCLYCLW